VKDKKQCTVSSCREAAKCRGWCNKHYLRWRKHGNPEQYSFHKTCTVANCTEPARGHGYCRKHYQRWRAHGDPLTSAYDRESEWTLNKDGYLRKTTYVAGRPVQVLRHRMVMEEILGRKLRRGETVHHKNGIRHDNKPENLELWIKRGQPPGQRLADIILWMVKNYPEEVARALKKERGSRV